MRFHALRCRHALCPLCPATERNVRTALWVGKLNSLEPTAAGNELTAARHITLTFAPEAWEWISANRATALPSLQQAWMELLAEVYGIKGETHRSANSHGGTPPYRVAGKRFSGVLNAHCITEEPHPQWPKAKPHFDIILSGVEHDRATGTHVYSPARWPEKWNDATERRWARLFARALMRAKAPIEITAQAMQRERLWITVSPMLDGIRARGAIGYSLRPMINLREAWIADNPDTHRPQLHYPVTTKHKEAYVHVVDLDLFMSAYWRLRSFIDGTESQRGFGMFGKGVYTTAVKRTGKPPVLSRKAKDDPTRKKMRKGYCELPGPPGHYEAFDPRDRATG